MAAACIPPQLFDLHSEREASYAGKSTKHPQCQLWMLVQFTGEYFDTVDVALEHHGLGSTCCPVCPKGPPLHEEVVAVSKCISSRRGKAINVSADLSRVELIPEVASCHLQTYIH